MLLWWNGRESTVCVFAVDKRRPRSSRRTVPPTATEPPTQATSIRSILNWLHTIYESYLKWEALPCNQSKMFFFLLFFLLFCSRFLSSPFAIHVVFYLIRLEFVVVTATMCVYTIYFFSLLQNAIPCTPPYTVRPHTALMIAVDFGKDERLNLLNNLKKIK